MLTQLQRSFDLIQARFSLSLIAEASADGREHFGFPGLYQQGIVVLLKSNIH